MVFWLFLLAFFQLSNCQILLAKLFSYDNSDNTKSIVYSSLNEIEVLEDYDPTTYPIAKNLGIAAIAHSPPNCSCPDLRKIHTITTSTGQLKFERADKLSTLSPGYKDYGSAGYLAPFPGYCSSDAIELLEFYSPVLNEFRYDTTNNIWNYYYDFNYFFRPVRVLGYAYYASDSVWPTGSPPYIKQGLSGMAQNALSVRFDPVRAMTKGSVTTFVVSEDLAAGLEALGYYTSAYYAGPLSAQNDLETIILKCGQLEKCVEVRDPRTNLTRPMNQEIQVIQGEILGDCGYFLSQNASSCFSYTAPYYSYIPSYNNNTVIYANYNDGGSGNEVGYTYPYTFAFLKL